MRRAAGAASLGLAFAFAGATFDTASLYLPAVALVLLSAGAAGWVRLAALGAAVKRMPGPHTVEEGRPYPLRLEVKAGVLPPPGGELTDPLLDAPVRIGGMSSRRVSVDVSFERRGRRLLEPGTLVIRDPLALAVREVTASGDDQHQELLVLPCVKPLLSADARGAGADGSVGGPDAGGSRAQLRGRLQRSAAELDIDGLRPYREGTPASRIHWPVVARSGEMVERRLSADADSAPLVVLDATAPPSEEALDRAVRAAASLCVHLARRGGCALLLPGERRPAAIGGDLATWPALHVRLALVEPTGTRPPLARARRAGAVFWVSARSDAPRELARAASGGGWLVSPGGPKGGKAEFTVAGCSGARIGRAGRGARAPAGRAA
ncbi:MAG TPA: DUF58 domain-containing protein [Thermoleophilaceae bacterium]|nr:DUF58 domain-containing protein [Thermoleophilaceae bacterium]